jgi:putative pyruvate formate lyase activating enzyme
MKNYRIIVPKDLEIRIQDLDRDFVPFVISLNPEYEPECYLPPEDLVTNFSVFRNLKFPDISLRSLKKYKTEELIDIHINMKNKGTFSASIDCATSLLDLKIELCDRFYRHCELCARRCGVNRYKEKGVCGLNEEAYFIETYNNLAEEAPINPSLTNVLFGCGLRCVACQNHHLVYGSPRELLDAGRARILNGSIWENEIIGQSTNTIQFTGGNPWENTLAILKFMKEAPKSLSKPIGLNVNAMATEYSAMLFDGVIDFLLLDVKCGNTKCSERITGFSGYLEAAVNSLTLFSTQNVKMIVRILIYPEHFTCCVEPILKEILAPFRDKIWISVLDQYTPLFNAMDEFMKRPSKKEIADTKELVAKLGYKDIKKNPEKFWSL